MRHESIKFNCKECGQEFKLPYCRVYPKTASHKKPGDFCSKECRRNNYVRLGTLICLNCKKSFVKRHGNRIQKYCHKKCQNEHFKKIGLQMTAHLQTKPIREVAKKGRVGTFKIGANHQWFKNGLRKTVEGYLSISSVIYGKENLNKLFHRYVMEKSIGRTLVRGEVVHHKDGNKLNNRTSNLELMTLAEHTKHHHKGIAKPRLKMKSSIC